MAQSRSPRRHVAPFVGPSWHIAAIYLAIALIVQPTLMHYVSIRGAVPSLVLVVVVWYAIRADAKRAAVYGLIAGICEDVLGGTTGAAFTISMTLTAAITSLLSRGFFADSTPLVSAITAVATLLRALFFWTTMALEGYPPGLGWVHFHQALWAALFNAIVMALAMAIVRRLDLTRT